MNDDLSSVLFFAHPDPLWIYDLETLRFLEVNDAAIRRYGYSRAEFLSMTIKDIRPAEDIAALLENVDAVTSGLDEAGVWRHQSKSGELMQVEIISHALEHHGRRAELVLVRDVSDRVDRRVEEHARALKSANRRLREQEANLRTAERLLGLGTWKFDVAANYLSWSPNLYAMYGIAPDDFGHRFEEYVELVHPEDRDAMIDNYRSFAAEDKPYLHFEHRVLRPDGSIVHVRGNGERTRMAGNIVITGVVQDVTDEEEVNRRLAEANRLVAMANRSARLGGWRVILDPPQVIWTEETALIHELPGVTRPDFREAINFFAPNDRPRIEARFTDCAREGVAYDEVLQLVTAKGNRRWVRAIGEPEHDADGRIVAVSGAFQDVSELIEARERSEELSRRLLDTLDHISDAFFTVDRNWRFTFLNERAGQLLRRDRTELPGQDMWEAFAQAPDADTRERYESAMNDGITARFVQYHAPFDAWFAVTAYPAANGIAVHVNDITREREREFQLRLLDNAIERLNDIVMITEAGPIDAPDGPRIIYVNDAFVRLTGYSREEAIGRTPRLLQGPDTDRTALDRIRTALETKQAIREELINVSRDGEAIWLEIDIAPLVDANGNHTHFVAVERDITDRKRAEMSARRNQERFELVARATNDVVWDWVVDDDSIWLNENFENVFGSGENDRLRDIASWVDRIHEEDRPRVDESLRLVLQSDSSTWRGEYRFRRADGDYAHVIDRGFVIRDDSGRAVRMIGSMLDVTERHELDERLRQSQKLEAVGQLTGGLAHDFNNLLTIILGNAELLHARLEGDKRLGKLAELTASAAQRGAELTHRMLAFARRQALAPRRIQPGKLVSGMESLLRRTLSESIDIKVIDNGTAWTIDVDPGQLEVAILNLAINARDAMPGGGNLTIEMSNAWLDEDYAHAHDEVVAGPYALLCVSDTGTGMTAEILNRAVDPFFTTKDVGKGSGLGLSMVYGFVKQSGGHLKIYSESGRGTTVKMYFPRADRGEIEESTTEQSREAVGGHEHVLIVEDDEMVRSHVIQQVESLGYRVSSASNGTHAMTVLERLPDVDLLFTDVIMPGNMNGRQLADAARAIRPDLKVLFTSGYTENAIVHSGRLDPGVQLLSKPYRLTELAAALRLALDRTQDGRG